MSGSGSGRVGGARGSPTIRAGIVSPAGVQRLACPPQTIISLPVQTAVCWYRAEGALVVLVAVQLSVLGMYLPPVFKGLRGNRQNNGPPQTIISLPVQTAV